MLIETRSFHRKYVEDLKIKELHSFSRCEGKKYNLYREETIIYLQE